MPRCVLVLRGGEKPAVLESDRREEVPCYLLQTKTVFTGPSTKITNLGALKIVLGFKNFIIYLIFVMGFSLITGLLVNMFFL